MKHLSSTKIKTDKLLKFYVSDQDFELVKADFESSGYQSMSAYLRRRFIGTGIIIHQPKVLLASLDTIGTEIDRIGNNVNQIAKNAQLMAKEGVLSVQLILEFNEVMAAYNENAKELASAYRKLLRNMS